MTTLTADEIKALRKADVYQYYDETAGESTLTVDRFIGNLTGNADTATHFASPSVINVTGNASGTISIHGSETQDLNLTVNYATNAGHATNADVANLTNRCSLADLANIANLARLSDLATNANHATSADHSTDADSATSATLDSAGNNIADTFSSHDTRISANNNKNIEQDTRLSNLETLTTTHTNQISAIQSLDDTQNGRLDNLEDFTNVLDWNIATLYASGNVVLFNYNFYQSLQDNNVGHYPSDEDSAYWKLLSETAGSGTADCVHLTGDETITGTKTFAGTIIVPTQSANDNSTKASSTAYTDNAVNTAKTAVETAISTGVTTNALTVNGNASISGTVTSTFSGDLTGNVTGNVQGNLTGDVTGNVQGNLTGNVQGNLTGDVTGDVTGNADTATTASKLGSSTVGSVSNPIYLNNGEATACTDVVNLASNQTISGVKTFSSGALLTMPNSPQNQDVVNKAYVDALINTISTKFASASYRRSSNFSSSKTVLTTSDNLNVLVGSVYYTDESAQSLDLTDSSNWDNVTDTDYTIASNRAGKDFYVYAVENSVTTAVKFILSANSTVPDGYTADTSRKVGGFHCLCRDVGTLTYYDQVTKTNIAHWLSGYVTGDIIPNTEWDLLHRAESENEGMVFDTQTQRWYDLYLASWDGSQLVSQYGGTTVDGSSAFPMHGEKFAEFAGYISKQLVDRDDFIVVAKGSNECTNISGSADAVTAGGHVDTANRRMISNIGLEDCCGFLWQWCHQSGGANGSTGWNNSVGNAGIDASAGQFGCSYGTYYRALVGCAWSSGGYCGSRCVGVSTASATVSAGLGGRLSAKERIINFI